MRVTHAVIGLIAIVAMSTLQAACIPSGESKPIMVTFDGEACRYDGPHSGPEGDWIVRLENKTEINVRLYVVRLEEDKTWQDMVDYIGEPGSPFLPVRWASTSIMTHPLDEPGSTEYKFTEGLYAISCCTGYDVDVLCHVWPGGSLRVSKD